MTGIVCAVRGGPDSQPTIKKAIEVAKETDGQLYFLYIVNLDFLAKTLSGRTHVVSNELHQMGEFILLNTQAVAAKQGVEAQIQVEHGVVGDEIIKFSQKIEADFVILGLPRGVGQDDVFNHNHLISFAERIEQETSAKVVFAEMQG